MIHSLQSFSRLFTSHPFELHDLFGTSVRSLAVLLLRWDRRPAAAAAEGPLPTTAACLSNIPVCGLWREHARQRVHLCGRASTEWKHSWAPKLEVLVGAAVWWVVLSSSDCGCWCRICNCANIYGFCFFSSVCTVCTSIALLWFFNIKNLEEIWKVKKIYLLYVYHIIAQANSSKNYSLSDGDSRNAWIESYSQQRSNKNKWCLVYEGMCPSCDNICIPQLGSALITVIFKNARNIILLKMIKFLPVWSYLSGHSFSLVLKSHHYWGCFKIWIYDIWLIQIWEFDNGCFATMMQMQ